MRMSDMYTALRRYPHFALPGLKTLFTDGAMAGDDDEGGGSGGGGGGSQAGSVGGASQGSKGSKGSKGSRGSKASRRGGGGGAGAGGGAQAKPQRVFSICAAGGGAQNTFAVCDGSVTLIFDVKRIVPLRQSARACPPSLLRACLSAPCPSACRNFSARRIRAMPWPSPCRRWRWRWWVPGLAPTTLSGVQLTNKTTHIFCFCIKNQSNHVFVRRCHGLWMPP